MGKLTDRLRELSRGSVQQMGFTSIATRPQHPSMLVAALSDVTDGEAVSQAIKADADAVLVTVGPATEDAALKTVRSAAQRVMWGGVLEVGGKEGVERLQKAGCDFVVLRGGTPAADSLTVEKIDKLLEIDPAWSDILVRGIEQLPVEGVLFRVVAGETLTIQQLLLCQRIIGLTRKPVLVALPPTVGPEQLLPLRDAGVLGVIVPPTAVKEFKTAVRALPPAKKPRDRLEAVLPLGLHLSHQEEDEEEDDS